MIDDVVDIVKFMEVFKRMKKGFGVRKKVKKEVKKEEVVDKKSGELKAQIKLGESAQLFIIENLEEIISTT